MKKSPSRPPYATLLIIVGVLLLGYQLGIRGTGITGFVTSLPSLFVQNGDTVNALTLSRMLKNKNFTLINVHTPYDGEIEKTDTFIPYDQIPANSGSLPKDKNAPIILYCRSGNMSAQALATFRKLGYTNVRHLAGGMNAWKAIGMKTIDLSRIEDDVVPQSGIELPITWGSLPGKLADAGIIDFQKFKEVVRLTPEQESLFSQDSDKHIKIDAANSQFIVDMLWAIGLAQKSIVYEEGPMGKEEKANAANFASTGGWTLAHGSPMQYLNSFDLIPLTSGQQQKVASIAKNVYRPCCGNSTWFPDCNHGMAALAAIEMMVAANIDEKTIYRNVLALNSYWFSDTYITTATYFARQGIPWDKVDAKTVLGEEYSSARGANTISRKVGPLPYHPTPQGGGCGA